VTIPTSTGITRLTIVAPGRRIDVALPDEAPLAALLPVVLDAVGDGLRGAADTAAGGWSVCRADGTRLALGRTLAALHIRDGEQLHLTPRDAEWPEPKYDDVVLAVADSTEALGGRWQAKHTRAGGLIAAGGALLVGLFVLMTSGPPWFWPGAVALGVALLAGVAGVVFARALGDSQTGGLIAAAALPYAFAGGVLVLGGDRPWSGLGSAHLLVGCAALLLVSLVGYLGAAEQLGLFGGGVVAALLGAFGAALSMFGVPAAAAEASVVVVALSLMPVSALLSLRLAGMPMPELPQSPRDLLADHPIPPRAQLQTAVERADQVLTGLLLGVSVSIAASTVGLVRHGGVAAPLLAGVVSALLLLRGRTLPRLRHRIPILFSGGLGAALVILAEPTRLPQTDRTMLVFAGLLPLAVISVAAGLRYARRAPGPWLGRLADIFEVVLALAVIPIVAGVFGLYGLLRGLAG
jgi:type VII secretion integral membrane protein EccD